MLPSWQVAVLTCKHLKEMPNRDKHSSLFGLFTGEKSFDPLTLAAFLCNDGHDNVFIEVGHNKNNHSGFVFGFECHKTFFSKTDAATK